MSFWGDVPAEHRLSAFSFDHLLYLVSVSVIVSLFIWKFSYIKQNLKQIKKILIFISLIQILALYSWSIFETGLSLEGGLPIHLCRISTFIGIYFMITENEKVLPLLYYFVPFAFIAISYPVNVPPLYGHVIGWSFQISHLLIILVWLIIVLEYKYKPSLKVMTRYSAWFMVFVLLVWQFNYLVGNGEYLYLRGDVNRPFFGQMPDLLWIGILMSIYYCMVLGMTLPFRKSDGDVVSN